AEGRFITHWGSYGSEPSQFYNPVDVAIDSSGNVYVTDCGNERIQKFNPD
ncbi:MAG: 6-bladed beta-propeller, partial [Gammaproteobacteria bacterium]|nr:6-bladed beta-propeller [Gammaproteobacteria bacterium]NIW99400.1 6-bladed beta-propeller [Phycisphaerae bacterium]